jgi:aromatic ring-cleaving dioxygenase
MGRLPQLRYREPMAESAIRDFHAHIYYDPEQVELARDLAAATQTRFPVAVGHFHLRPVGPHPRGSCQFTVPAELFGDVAQWLVLKRGTLTIFAHANTGDDLADHTRHVIWFGESEKLDLSIFS